MAQDMSQWRQAGGPLVLRWRGQTRHMLLIPRSGQPTPLAAVIAPPGSANRYRHLQPTPSTMWTVNHNLGDAPAGVSVRTPGGVEVEAEIVHVSVNQLLVYFVTPMAGSAIVI